MAISGGFLPFLAVLYIPIFISSPSTVYADSILGCGGFVEASPALIKSTSPYDPKLDYTHISAPPLLIFSTERIDLGGREQTSHKASSSPIPPISFFHRQDGMKQILSKANYLPNGLDFPTHQPTGRYTNARTIVDIIGEAIGLDDFTPPYLAPSTSGDVILKGANYASGGGGILNKTGQIFVGRINLDAQIDNFANTRQDIITIIGTDAASSLIDKSLFSLTIGSNDFINNYLTPVLSVPERAVIPPEVFVDSMISKFRLQLTRLYYLGARKIIVVNVGPIGCIPYQRETNADGNDCAKFPNQLAQSYNAKLKTLVSELSSELERAILVYANVYDIVVDIIQNYKSYGFNVADSACCFVGGRFGGLIPCGPTSKVCPDRSKYVFWDPYHPSDTANSIIAKRLLNGGEGEVSPMNVRQLVNA